MRFNIKKIGEELSCRGEIHLGILGTSETIYLDGEGGVLAALSPQTLFIVPNRRDLKFYVSWVFILLSLAAVAGLVCPTLAVLIIIQRNRNIRSRNKIEMGSHKSPNQNSYTKIE